jgi:hypothetical protein
MPQILRTTRRLPRETLTGEAFTGLDAQGMPAYDSPVEFDANVLEYDAAQFSRGAEFVVMPDGSRVVAPLTLYVLGDAPWVPSGQDRVTLPDYRRFIVAEVKPVSGLRHARTAPDHHRLRCRVE